MSRVSVASRCSSSAGCPHVAGGGMGLGQAHGDVAAARSGIRRSIVGGFLVLEAGEEAVELAALEVELGQLFHHVELVVELF